MRQDDIVVMLRGLAKVTEGLNVTLDSTLEVVRDLQLRVSRLEARVAGVDGGEAT